MYLNISSLVQPHAPHVWVFGLRSQHKQFSSGGEVFAESIAYAGFWADALVCLLYSCHLCPCCVGSLCPNVCLASLFSLAIHCLTAEVFSQLLGSCTLKFPAQDDQVCTFSCVCTALCAALSWASSLPEPCIYSCDVSLILTETWSRNALNKKLNKNQTLAEQKLQNCIMLYYNTLPLKSCICLIQ